jgi:site-specific recombinase XerD
MASLYKKKSGYWYITGYNEGKKFFLSTHSKSKTKAQYALDDFKRNNGQLTYQGDTTFESFINVFRQYIQTHLRRKTIELYEMVIRNMINYKDRYNISFNSYRLKNISYIALENFVMSLKERYSITSVNMHIRCIKAIFNYAIKIKYLKDNPAEHLKQLETFRKNKIYIPDEHLQLIIDNADGNMKDIILISLYTACRRNEIINMRYMDIDINKRTINIKSDEQFQTKHKHDRVIYISDELKDILNKFYYDEDGTAILHAPEERLFDIKSFSVTHRFKRICRKLALPESYHFHCLWHTAISNLSSAGATLKSIMTIAGHSSIRTTENYLHNISKDIINAVNLVSYKKL